MAVSRRTLLKYGALGALALAAGGVGLSLQGTVLRTPRRALQVMNQRTFSILAAIADRIAPGGDGLPGAWELQVPEQIDAYLAGLHPDSAEEFLQVLRLIENALTGLVFAGRVRPFSALPPEAQDAVLEDWRTSALSLRRAAFKAVCNLCNSTYWGQHATWGHVGYPGPPDYASWTVGDTVGEEAP